MVSTHLHCNTNIIVLVICCFTVRKICIGPAVTNINCYNTILRRVSFEIIFWRKKSAFIWNVFLRLHRMDFLRLFLTAPWKKTNLLPIFCIVHIENEQKPWLESIAVDNEKQTYFCWLISINTKKETIFTFFDSSLSNEKRMKFYRYNGCPIKNCAVSIFEISPLLSSWLKHFFYQKIALEILYKILYE